MKIAVVGGGIFGTTIAIKLAQNGLEVDLYEKNGELLSAASGINQYRIHRGYHYPRSKDTALSSKFYESSFRREYGDAVVEHNEHFYVLAKDRSLVTGEHFLNFCRECELEHEKVRLEHVHPHMVDFVIKGKESLMDPIKLRKIVRDRLNMSRVNVLLNTLFTSDSYPKYGFVINSTYANLNSVLEHIPEGNVAMKPYQFELCEKPVLSLPESFRGKSIVVLDGPFFCIDPYSDTGYHVMGNVVHAIHTANIGLHPEIPKEFLPLINRGVIKNPSITNIDKFIEAAIEFMPELKDVEHIGSMYTFRTVLPNVEHTDERPTIVSRVSDKVINVFSGKIGNCVEAADKVLALVLEKDNARSTRERAGTVL